MKKINALIIDTSNMTSNRNARQIKILGDVGAKFSLMIRNEDDANMLDTNIPGYNSDYYFRPVTGVVKGALKKVSIPAGGTYSFVQSFPEVTDDDKYDITIIAEEGTELSENIPTPRDNTGARLPTYSIYQYLNLGQVTFGITTASSDWTSPFPADIIVKRVPEGNATIKIHWNLVTTSAIAKDREARFSSSDHSQSDFTGTAPVDLILFSAANDTNEIKLATSAAPTTATVTGLTAGMPITGTGLPTGQTTISSINAGTNVVTISQNVTLGQYSALNFGTGGTILEFSTFKISEPYTIGSNKYIDFDAVGTVRFGDYAITCNLDLDSLTTLS